MRKSLKGILPSGLPPDPRDPFVAEILARAQHNALMSIAHSLAWRLALTPEGRDKVLELFDVAIRDASKDWDPFPINAKGERKPASWVFAKERANDIDQVPIGRTDAIRVVVVKSVERAYVELRSRIANQPIDFTEPDDGE